MKKENMGGRGEILVFSPMIKNPLMKLMSATLALIFLFNVVCPSPAYAWRPGNYGEKGAFASFAGGFLAGAITSIACIINPVAGAASAVASDVVSSALYYHDYQNYNDPWFTVKIFGWKKTFTKGEVLPMLAGIVAGAAAGFVSGLASGAGSAGTAVAEGGGQGIVDGATGAVADALAVGATTSVATSAASNLFTRIINAIVSFINKVIIAPIRNLINFVIDLFKNPQGLITKALNKLRNMRQAALKNPSSYFKYGTMGLKGLPYMVLQLAADMTSAVIKMVMKAYVADKLQQIFDLDPAVAEIAAEAFMREVGNSFVDGVVLSTFAAPFGLTVQTNGGFASGASGEDTITIDGKKVTVSEAANTEVIIEYANGTQEKMTLAEAIDKGLTGQIAFVKTGDRPADPEAKPWPTPGGGIYKSVKSMEGWNKAVSKVNSYLTGEVGAAERRDEAGRQAREITGTTGTVQRDAEGNFLRIVDKRDDGKSQVMMKELADARAVVLIDGKRTEVSIGEALASGLEIQGITVGDKFIGASRADLQEISSSQPFQNYLAALNNPKAQGVYLWRDVHGNPISKSFPIMAGMRAVQNKGLGGLAGAAVKVAALSVLHYTKLGDDTGFDRAYKLALAEAAGGITAAAVDEWDGLGAWYAGTSGAPAAASTAANQTAPTDQTQANSTGAEPAAVGNQPQTPGSGETPSQAGSQPQENTNAPNQPASSSSGNQGSNVPTGSVDSLAVAALPESATALASDIVKTAESTGKREQANLNPYSSRPEGMTKWDNFQRVFAHEVVAAGDKIAWAALASKYNWDPVVAELGHLFTNSYLSAGVDAIFRRDPGKAEETGYTKVGSPDRALPEDQTKIDDRHLGQTKVRKKDGDGTEHAVFYPSVENPGDFKFAELTTTKDEKGRAQVAESTTSVGIDQVSGVLVKYDVTRGEQGEFLVTGQDASGQTHTYRVLPTAEYRVEKRQVDAFQAKVTKTAYAAGSPPEVKYVEPLTREKINKTFVKVDSARDEERGGEIITGTDKHGNVATYFLKDSDPHLGGKLSFNLEGLKTFNKAAWENFNNNLNLALFRAASPFPDVPPDAKGNVSLEAHRAKQDEFVSIIQAGAQGANPNEVRASIGTSYIASQATQDLARSIGAAINIHVPGMKIQEKYREYASFKPTEARQADEINRLFKEMDQLLGVPIEVRKERLAKLRKELEDLDRREARLRERGAVSSDGSDLALDDIFAGRPSRGRANERESAARDRELEWVKQRQRAVIDEIYEMNSLFPESARIAAKDIVSRGNERKELLAQINSDPELAGLMVRVARLIEQEEAFSSSAVSRIKPEDREALIGMTAKLIELRRDGLTAGEKEEDNIITSNIAKMATRISLGEGQEALDTFTSRHPEEGQTAAQNIAKIDGEIARLNNLLSTEQGDAEEINSQLANLGVQRTEVFSSMQKIEENAFQADVYKTVTARLEQERVGGWMVPEDGVNPQALARLIELDNQIYAEVKKLPGSWQREIIKASGLELSNITQDRFVEAAIDNLPNAAASIAGQIAGLQSEIEDRMAMSSLPGKGIPFISAMTTAAAARQMYGNVTASDFVTGGIVDYTVDRKVVTSAPMSPATEAATIAKLNDDLAAGTNSQDFDQNARMALETGTSRQVISSYSPSISGIAMPSETYGNEQVLALNRGSGALRNVLENEYTRGLIVEVAPGEEKVAYDSLLDQSREKEKGLSEEARFVHREALKGSLVGEKVKRTLEIEDLRKDSQLMRLATYIPGDEVETPDKKQNVQTIFNEVSQGRTVFLPQYALLSRTERDQYGRPIETSYYGHDYVPSKNGDAGQWEHTKLDRSTKYYSNHFGTALVEDIDNTAISLPDTWPGEKRTTIERSAKPGEIVLEDDRYLARDAAKREEMSAKIERKEGIWEMPQEDLRAKFMQMSEEQRMAFLDEIFQVSKEMRKDLGYDDGRGIKIKSDLSDATLSDLHIVSAALLGKTSDGRDWSGLTIEEKKNIIHGQTGWRLASARAYEADGVTQDWGSLKVKPGSKAPYTTSYDMGKDYTGRVAPDRVNVAEVKNLYLPGSAPTEEIIGKEVEIDKLYSTGPNVTYEMNIYSVGGGQSPWTGPTDKVTHRTIGSGIQRDARANYVVGPTVVYDRFAEAVLGLGAAELLKKEKDPERIKDLEKILEDAGTPEECEAILKDLGLTDEIIQKSKEDFSESYNTTSQMYQGVEILEGKIREQVELHPDLKKQLLEESLKPQAFYNIIKRDSNSGLGDQIKSFISTYEGYSEEDVDRILVRSLVGQVIIADAKKTQDSPIADGQPEALATKDINRDIIFTVARDVYMTPEVAAMLSFRHDQTQEYLDSELGSVQEVQFSKYVHMPGDTGKTYAMPTWGVKSGYDQDGASRFDRLQAYVYDGSKIQDKIKTEYADAQEKGNVQRADMLGNMRTYNLTGTDRSMITEGPQDSDLDAVYAYRTKVSTPYGSDIELSDMGATPTIPLSDVVDGNVRIENIDSSAAMQDISAALARAVYNNQNSSQVAPVPPENTTAPTNSLIYLPIGMGDTFSFPRIFNRTDLINSALNDWQHPVLGQIGQIPMP